MLTNKRMRIKRGDDEVADLVAGAAFSLDGTDYPRNWIALGGTIPGYTTENYDVIVAEPEPEAIWTLTYSVVLDRMTDLDANALDNYVERLPAKDKVRIKTFGIESDDMAFRDKVAQLGADPDVILAP